MCPMLYIGQVLAGEQGPSVPTVAKRIVWALLGVRSGGLHAGYNITPRGGPRRALGFS